MNWSDIEKVNGEISTMNFKGKEYAEVKERVIAYRKLCPDGTLNTTITFTENYVLCEATATNNEGKQIANGHARELLNKPFALEVVETSAIGRCLGFMGLGINTSLASKEDMEQLESPSGLFKNEEIGHNELVLTVQSMYSTEEIVQILNKAKVLDLGKLSNENLNKLIERRKNANRNA